MIALAIFCIICLIILTSVSAQSQFMHSPDTYEYDYNKSKSSEKGVTHMNKFSTTPTSKGGIISSAENITPDTQVGSITQLVNQEFTLPSTYKPDDLVVPDVLFNINHYEEKKLMREEAAAALEELFSNAKKANLSLCAVSGFRSYQRQVDIYNKNLATKGSDFTNKYSAKPGSSEHQTGLTIDVSTASISNSLSEVFEGTPEGKWLAQNAYQCGFILRYPKDKETITGYAYEPWHIRYVGKDLAKHLYENNLALEEYYHYTPSKKFLDKQLTDKTIDEVDKTMPSKSPTPVQSTAKPAKTYQTAKPSITKQPLPTQNNTDIDNITESEIPIQTKKPFKAKSPQNTKIPLKETPMPEKTTEPQQDKLPEKTTEPQQDELPEKTTEPPKKTTEPQQTAEPQQIAEPQQTELPKETIVPEQTTAPQTTITSEQEPLQNTNEMEKPLETASQDKSNSESSEQPISE